MTLNVEKICQNCLVFKIFLYFCKIKPTNNLKRAANPK